MTIWIVTIKLKRNLKHNPHNKKSGYCFFSHLCTDVTGAHHCFLVKADNTFLVMKKVREKFPEIHITRIERASYLEDLKNAGKN